MPVQVPSMHPFNYGAAIGQAENILSSQAARDPNSVKNQLYAAQLQTELAGGNRLGKYNPGDYTPESWQKWQAAGARDQDANMLRRYQPYKVVTIGGVDQLVSTDDQAATMEPIPLSTIQGEGDAAAYLASQEQVGTQAAQAGMPVPTPTAGSPGQPAPVAAPVNVPSQAQLAGQKETAIKEAAAQVDFKWKGVIAASVKQAEALAVERGEVLTDLQRMEASLPGLTAATERLKALAKVSTSTIAGKAWDTFVKEAGFGATEGADAQARFIAIINNQVLPLLKPTFGAAFTVQEGETLKATMGDPNASPSVKIAQLEEFMDLKARQVREKKAQIRAIDASGTSATGMSDAEYMKRKQSVLGQ